MTLILSHLDEGPDKDLVENWYHKDTNAIPAEYVLQEITKLVDDNNTVDIAQARAKWADIEVNLKECIRRSVKQCQHDGKIDDLQAAKYFWSGENTLCTYIAIYYPY